MEPKSSFFQGVSKYLIVIMFVFFILLLVEIFIIFVNNRRKILTSPTVQQNITPTNTTIQQQNQQQITVPTPMSAVEVYKKNSETTPFNQIAFEEFKKQLPKDEVFQSTSLFRSQIIAIETKPDKILLTLKSLEKNGLNKTVWYSYAKSIQDKLTVVSIQNTVETPITLDELKKDDMIEIYEKNDYSKNYPDSVMSIKIVKK